MSAGRRPASAAAQAWAALRAATPARIGLGRTGNSLPCAEVLRFGLAHAQARDAVHRAFDADGLAAALRRQGGRVLRARSEACDRATYLLRPDLGRRLHADSRQALLAEEPAPLLAIVAADGLSAVAVERHVPPLLAALRGRFDTDWTNTPVIVVDQGRVAIGDGIGEALGARLVAVLIGERPGLSSPDSLGIYLTHAPRVGRMDSERNCISNVRPDGLSYDEAAYKLGYLMSKSMRLGMTGVALKDDSDWLAVAGQGAPVPGIP